MRAGVAAVCSPEQTRSAGSGMMCLTGAPNSIMEVINLFIVGCAVGKALAGGRR